MSTYSTKTEDAIRDIVFKKAQDLEIPIGREQIKVQRSGSQGTGTIPSKRIHRPCGPAGISSGPEFPSNHKNAER